MQVTRPYKQCSNMMMSYRTSKFILKYVYQIGDVKFIVTALLYLLGTNKSNACIFILRISTTVPTFDLPAYFQFVLESGIGLCIEASLHSIDEPGIKTHRWPKCGVCISSPLMQLYSIFVTCMISIATGDSSQMTSLKTENTSCYILHDVRHVSPHYGSGIIRQHENLTLYSQEENERGSVQLNRAVTSNECLFRLT